ncbi:S1 RNA-binding domain-containing protein [Streptomyces wuyuanensis]|uniref:Small subunit ribosomal protein S1 n=1 Tax=Streptomyces wuyuanensis TaxID=1196353 RepID=A0A1H0CXR2_9ACTN|nr:S1 RNA-binding domain-containing protein [Streptomyces wuyuanensis]SDN62586.1 small subunit ribosomal protein S1 [Streptomyces wuyuanensis]
MIERSKNPELWDLLDSLQYGDLLSGKVAAIERFGVFVDLDDVPDHPVFPGVGFIALPDLSWRSFEDASEIVHIGQSVSCMFLQFDTWNVEARLSLRANRPDPFQAFADATDVGQELRTRVTKVLPFGVVVEIFDEVEAVIHRSELAGEPATAHRGEIQVGDDITVVVLRLDRERRTVSLSQRQARPHLG